MAVIAIPSILRDKLGDEGVEAFTEVIKEIDLEARKESITIVEERFERRLTEETGKIRVEIEKIRVEVAASKAGTLKWMFIFWIGQIGVLSGIIFAMLKLYFK